MGSQKASTSATFPQFLKNEMRNINTQARGLYNDTGTSMIPQLNQWTQQGLANQAAMAQSGNSVAGPALGQANKILSGGYLDVTKDPAFQRNVGAAMGMASDRFAGSGRVGSGAYAGALGDAATGVAAQMYDVERQRQMQTLGMTPQLIGAQYADAAALQDSGQAMDEDAMARFDWPYARLDRYANTVYGSPAAQNPGQQSTTGANAGNFVLGLLHPLSSRSS